MTQRGFSMIDLIVWLLVSLLITLAVTSTWIGMQQSARASQGAATAFENAQAVAYVLQRAGKSAGGSGCATLNASFKGTVYANNSPVLDTEIIDGGGGDDTLNLSGLATLLGGMPLGVASAPPADLSSVTLLNAIDIAANDIVVVGQSGQPCTVRQVTAVAAGGGGTVLSFDAAADWNGGGFAPNYDGTATVRKSALQQHSFSLVNNQFVDTDPITGAVTVLADNIVRMKAWYGTNNGATGQIEQWVPATNAWAVMDTAHAAAVQAVRVAVVARSQSRRTSCDATAPQSWPDGPDLTPTAADWRCYDYRTVILTIPLKNKLFRSA